MGPYPPPPGGRTPAVDPELAALLARPPVVTRYGRTGRRAPGAARRPASRAWAAASAALAAASVGTVLVLPQGTAAPVREAVPAVEVAPLTPAQRAAATPATGAAAAPAGPRQLPASEPVAVRIPVLGVTAQVMHLGLERDGSMQVPPGAHPVGWYDRSPTPGEPGPAVLAGHVDWEGTPGAFYGLRELRAGDAVVVDRADGTVATFLVERVEEHDKDDFPTGEVYGDIDHAGLRLITCGGSFDADTGDYEANVIVFARLLTR